MDFDNKLTQKEIEEKDYNQLKETYNINNFENSQEIRYFEVLSDGEELLVSIKDMRDICTQISLNQLEALGVKLNVERFFGEEYLKVNVKFLIYVKENTKHPKYIPNLGWVRIRELSEYASTGIGKISTQIAQTVDGQVSYERTR